MEMILERLIALNARQTKEQTRAFVKECQIVLGLFYVEIKLT